MANRGVLLRMGTVTLISYCPPPTDTPAVRYSLGCLMRSPPIIPQDTQVHTLLEHKPALSHSELSCKVSWDSPNYFKLLPHDSEPSITILPWTAGKTVTISSQVCLLLHMENSGRIRSTDHSAQNLQLLGLTQKRYQINVCQIKVASSLRTCTSGPHLPILALTPPSQWHICLSTLFSPSARQEAGADTQVHYLESPIFPPQSICTGCFPPGMRLP